MRQRGECWQKRQPEKEIEGGGLGESEHDLHVLLRQGRCRRPIPRGSGL